ncbi:hypothetical protein KY311_01995, partial [Candidatus Woesearchaeota archaeon]|nr:hypothetical protein [Candidatus Woesearchaeota archaeon]
NAKKVIREEQKSALQEEKEYEIPEEAVPEDRFPPCIKAILNGLEDGRKRGLFILVNFMLSCGWSHEQTQARLIEWNKQNAKPLREQDIINRVNYSKQKKQVAPPPNCDNKTYFVDIGVCKPDHICARIKNPVTYTKRVVFTEKKKKKAVKKEKIEDKLEKQNKEQKEKPAKQ